MTKMLFTLPFIAESGIGYDALFWLIIVALVTVVGMLILSWLFGPGRQGKIKSIPYESGIDPVGNARQPFHARFYMLAIMFLVFDVELIFFYPFASIYMGAGPSPAKIAYLIAIIIFTILLVVALLYDIASGVFDWK